MRLAYAAGLVFTGVTGIGAGIVLAKLRLVSSSFPLLWLTWVTKAADLKRLPNNYLTALELIFAPARALPVLISVPVFSGVRKMVDQSPANSRRFSKNKTGHSNGRSPDEHDGSYSNLDLKFFATSLILQRQTGGDLAEILDKIVIWSQRFQIWGQVQHTGERSSVGRRALGVASGVVRGRRLV